MVRNELSVFISPSDYMLLPANCFVIGIGLEVIPISMEASFQTGNTLAGSTTLKHSETFQQRNKRGYRFGRGFYRHGEDMKIKGIKDTEPIAEIKWSKSEGTCLPSNYKNYDSFIIPKGNYTYTGNIFSKGVDFGQYALSKVYSKFNLNRMISAGKSFIWNYQIIGLYKTNFKSSRSEAKDDQFIISSQHQPMGVYNILDQSNLKKPENNYGPLSVTNNTNYLTYVIEHGFWSGQLNRDNSTPLTI